jgi:3-oxoacyl-ACP reductase-like protein
MTMGFFSTILDKLGLSKAEAATPAATAPAPTAAPAPASAAAPASAPAAPVVNPIAMVDVVALMEAKAKANPQKLNWRTSIVDLLKLLDMDSSLQARKELAKELYCPDELMNDSAKMNVWLHKNVLAHIAANGGNIPKELLD